MNRKRTLENEIEELRKKLDLSVSKYGFNDERTICLSHKLDRLLNQYNKIYQLKNEN